MAGRVPGGRRCALVLTMRRRLRTAPRRLRTAVLAAAAIAAAGCGAATTTTTTTAVTPATTSTATAQRHATTARARRHARRQTAAPVPAAHAATRTAGSALPRLPVKGRAPKTGYTREQFGDGWSDAEGCDTRDRILARDLTAKTYLDSCRVGSGALADPYTAQRIEYTRGASEVDIDHVVALSDAWQKGAQQWGLERRVAFANDPLELLAVDAHTNRSKGDGDAATWLPSNKAFRCDYVARQVAVKIKYHLWVTQAEKAAISRVLATCPGQKLPAAGARIRVTVSHAAPTPTTTSSSHSTTVSGGGGGSGVGHVYANCTAARAAGVTPILRGTPDYAANPKLDRDHDGVACES
jgi:hypothetical protein